MSAPKLATLVAASVLALGLGRNASAMTFAEAFDAAQRNDAQYRAAGHELDSARLAVPMARAALLPVVGFNAATAEVNGSRQFPNSLNQDTRVRVEYSSPQASLSLRVPIYNQEARSRWQYTQAQSDAAESVYRSRGTELIDRLAAAYLQVLLAEEVQRLADAQVEALTVQTRQADQRFKRGEGTRVDVAQTQAALDLARVRSLEATDALDLARRQMRRITGLPSEALKRAPTDLVPDGKPLESLVDWLQIALRQSPSLQAREQALVAARMNVSRNFAGHLPRVDLVASVSRSQNESLNTLNQTSTLKSLGLQLSVPIYNGGGVDASVKQAMADQSRVEEEIRSERENIEVEVQRHYMAVTNGSAKIGAYHRAVESSELALLGTRRVLEQGLGTNNDVADAQARLYGAQRDLAQARIEYLQSRLRLMLHAGLPMIEVVTELDRSLTGAPSAQR